MENIEEYEERELAELFDNIQLENLEDMQREYEMQNVNDFMGTRENEEGQELEIIPMEIEELMTNQEIRELKYKVALDKLLQNDVQGFLDSEIIQKEFPKRIDEIRPYCISMKSFETKDFDSRFTGIFNKDHINKITSLSDLYGEYLALWRGELYSEKSVNTKTGDTLYILSYSKGGNANKKYISAECFITFQALIDLVNITKFMAIKMESLRKKNFPLSYDFQTEILSNIEKALFHVFQVFLK